MFFIDIYFSVFVGEIIVENIRKRINFVKFIWR